MSHCNSIVNEVMPNSDSTAAITKHKAECTAILITSVRLSRDSMTNYQLSCYATFIYTANTQYTIYRHVTAMSYYSDIVKGQFRGWYG